MSKKMKKPQPYIVVGKKKHPFGKPIEIHFDKLRMWIAPTYMTKFGFTNKGELGMGSSKVEHLTLFFESKKEDGWVQLDKITSRKLYEALKKIYDEKKNGTVKKTYPGFTITKNRRYKK